MDDLCWSNKHWWSVSAELRPKAGRFGVLARRICCTAIWCFHSCSQSTHANVLEQKESVSNYKRKEFNYNSHRIRLVHKHGRHFGTPIWMLWRHGKTLCRNDQVQGRRTRDQQQIGHFRVPLCLCFKASLSAKPFLWKWFRFAWKWTACRTHFHLKGFALRLVLKQRHKRTRKWPIN